MYAKINIMEQPIPAYMPTLAERFHILFGTKYTFDLHNYEDSASPSYFANARVKRAALCQYRIKFTDRSDVACLMRSTQRVGLDRLWDYEKQAFRKYGILSVNDEGHKKLKIIH